MSSKSYRLIAPLCLFCIVGCHSPKSLTPAEEFNRIYAEFLRGRLDSSRQKASAERVLLLNRDPSWSFKFCLLEAEILQFQGRSQDIVRVLEPQGRTFSPDGDQAIKQNILLSLANARLGRQQLSSQELQEAQALSRVTHSSLQGEVLRTEGLIENHNGQQALAQQSFRASLQCAREQKDEYLEASDLLNLGLVALQKEHIDEALDSFNASSELADKIHAEVILQSDEGDAGWAYYALGDFDQALQSFLKAEAQAQSIGAADGRILWLQSAGLSLFRLGDWKQAQSCYEDALRAAQSLEDTARRAEIETSLGFLFLELNQLDAARSHAGAALDAAQQIGVQPSILDASLLQALIAARTRGSPEAERMLLKVLRAAADMPSIRWEAQDALAGIYEARQMPAQSNLWHQQSIKTYETQRSSLRTEDHRLPFAANGGDLYRHYAEFLISAQRSTDALNVLDSARAKILKEGLEGRLVGQSHAFESPAVIRRGQGIILFYSLGSPNSYLWEMDRSGTRLFVLPPGAEIASHLKSYQASILQSADPLLERNPESLWLYRNLVGPAEAFIPANARVFVIPDGSLNGFNMETLLKPGPQGLRYWIEDVSITTATSIQLLARTRPPPDSKQSASLRSQKLLLMGDPLEPGASQASLPHAAAEVENVERYFADDRRTTLTRAAAVPEAYPSSHPEQYAYLHFVAHGMASSLHPLDSAIVLSPSAADSDHFKLYARDIIHQPLDARLVTISACNGSGVRNYAQEGLVGLSWAFLRAGAHQVIAALWEVSDNSTPQLMDQMYRELVHGAAPDQALRAAKLSMLHSQTIFRKPLYWAPFQLYTGSY